MPKSLHLPDNATLHIVNIALNHHILVCIVRTNTKEEGSVKNVELIALLKKNGRIPVRIKGSHYQFRHPDFAGAVTVPHPRNDMKPGTLHQILKHARLK